ncbi:MAG: stage II sporulation protein R [Ruminococcaceae bacterium]|nr:stage II sporulation protein R [Oscillospiraceae bacterium]
MHTTGKYFIDRRIDMKKLFVVCIVFLVISIGFVSFSAADFRDGFIRLHILAESDAEEDQRIKLQLRDALLKEYSEALSVSKNSVEAETRIENMKEDIEDFCNDYLDEIGADYDARILFEKEYYPNRVYDNVTLPAGTYSSLKVVLGNGDGKNWWCVLFPPLCLDIAKGEEAYIAAGLSKDDYETIINDRSGKYEYRFKLFELFGSLFK